MSSYNYIMQADWRVTPESPSALGERFLETLDRIAAGAPEVGEWTIVDLWDNVRLLPIDEARNIMTRLVENNVSRDDYDEPDPDFGYHMLGVNTPTITPQSLNWDASVGGRFGDRITFEVGSVMVPSDLEIVSYPLFRTALLTTIDLWPSTWANAFADRRYYDEVSPAPGIPPHPSSRYIIPWISYLSAPLAEKLVVPDDISIERTPDGGLLMIAAKERLDPTDPDHMRRSRKIAEIMIERAGEPSS